MLSEFAGRGQVAPGLLYLIPSKQVVAYLKATSRVEQ